MLYQDNYNSTLHIYKALKQTSQQE